MIEPTTVDEALSDDGWIIAMQEELNQFQRNDVWDLVPKPQNKNIIGTKWVFRNKLNEQGEDYCLSYCSRFIIVYLDILCFLLVCSFHSN